MEPNASHRKEIDKKKHLFAVPVRHWSTFCIFPKTTKKRQCRNTVCCTVCAPLCCVWRAGGVTQKKVRSSRAPNRFLATCCTLPGKTHATRERIGSKGPSVAKLARNGPLHCVCAVGPLCAVKGVFNYKHVNFLAWLKCTSNSTILADSRCHGKLIDSSCYHNYVGNNLKSFYPANKGHRKGCFHKKTPFCTVYCVCSAVLCVAGGGCDPKKSSVQPRPESISSDLLYPPR
jgi:hypothetical protein